MLALCLVFGAAAVQAAGAIELRQAVRTLPGEAALPVTLPDKVQTRPGPPGLLRPAYALEADLGAAPPRHLAIYLPGAYNRMRIRLNGELVFDSIREPLPSAPRGADRLLLHNLPEAFVRPGVNRIGIELASARITSLSPVWIGPVETLAAMHARKRWWQVYAPVVAAAIMLSLSACVLLLWARRRSQTLYAYFGAGGVIWSLHNAWTVLPKPLLPAPHESIWWTLGFSLYVVPLIVFCVRLAEWRLPRFERALWLGLAAGPPLLYTAHAFGALESALVYWRMLSVGAVGVGVWAVGRYARRRRDVYGLLLFVAGALAFAFGVHDLIAERDPDENNPIYLTYFSGLLFFPLMAWMLIDGFVQASRELERMNVDLEQRVAEKSVALTAAVASMRAAKERAETADRAKSSFLAAASHDLRQPMHALGLYLAALRSTPDDPAQADLVAHMGDSVDALQGMFDALLDVSRIDAGAVEPKVVVFALAPLLHRITEDFGRQAADKGLRLSVHVGSAALAGWNARSDPVLVERILRNLLANAVKYTAEGGVLLACRLRTRGGDGGGATPLWRVEVWDSGPGIAAAEQERVFQEFFQIGNPERNRAEGLGLGLSIVRRLAHLLGHRLALDSIVGHGSRFSLELPADTEPVAAGVPAIDPTSIEGLSVAVIDDDAQVRESMSVLLRHWGCDVVAGASAEDVLACAGSAAAQRLRAAVVDYQLRDGRTGIEAIQALRAVCGSALPALLVSGASSASMLAQVRASGCPWLSKPVAAARLRSWLVQAARELTASSSEPA